MATIALFPISVFDANFAYTFEYTYQGNQSVKNKLTIYDNDTNAVVYSGTETTYKLSHMLASNVLSNGKNYNAEITAYDIFNTETTSSKISFKCYATPIWRFLNVSEGQTVRNANLVANIEYFQAQNDLINEYRVVLYSSNKSERWNSGVKLSPVSPIEVGGLIDSTLYYIRALGKTVSGFNLDTGYIGFYVQYDSLALNQVLMLENREREGSVKITSRIIVIEGRGIPDPPKFIDNEMVDLRDPGNMVIFDEGFTLEGDYIIEFIGRNFLQNETLLYASDGWSGIRIFWRKGEFLNQNNTRSIHTFVELRAYPSPYYCVFSNHINENINNTVMCHVWLRRVNGLYEVKLYRIP